ncbi:MAG: box helicase domain protein [Lacrimispora sp.]|nr:box helicase domain protein [Lacrimispora sp.]
MQFKDLNIMPDIIKALEKESYENPTPIQEEAIPVILEGRDLLGCAQTGTGKTAAFAIPTLQLLSHEKANHTSKQNIKALVITPTRELALQIHESFNTYGQFTSLKSCVVFGGVSQKPQEEELKRGVDILVATPGRLLALMDQRLINIDQIKILILDEADRMLDMGFINDVKKIIAKTPPKKQTLFFSATMPPDIARLAGTILKNPAEIKITPVSSTVDTIDQYLYFTDKSSKKDLLLHILEDKEIVSALVFVRTKHGADRLIRQLAKSNVSAQAIHGDKSQGARQRALSSFKDKTLRILLATDIAARGIDIDELTHVINFDLPDTPETYVHRIGRTGRAGLGGTAISFCDFDEKEQLKDIERLIGKRLAEVKDHPYPLKNNFPAIKTTQPKRDTERTERPERQRPQKPKSSSHKSSPTSRKESSQSATSKKASLTKKKFRMTADGTLKEKRNYNSFSTKRKSS